MMKKVFLLSIIILLSLVIATIAADFDETVVVRDNNSISVSEDVSNMSLDTQKIIVQRVAKPRELTVREFQEIAKFLEIHRKNLSLENYNCLKIAIPLLVGIGQSHVPLTRKPKQYLSDYQVITQITNSIDWHINMPKQQPLPVFVPSDTTIKLVAPDLVASNSTCAVAPKQVGAKRFGQNGQNEEVPIGFAGYRKTSKCKDESSTCDPGGHPAPPPSPADVP